MFTTELCTEAIFEQLGLPASLREDPEKNPIGTLLVFDLESRSALVPHRFHHSDWPDRGLDFFYDGRHHLAWECVQRSNESDRVELYLPEVPDTERTQLVDAFRAAHAIFRAEEGALPVVVKPAL
jgi:hypothetical protein